MASPPVVHGVQEAVRCIIESSTDFYHMHSENICESCETAGGIQTMREHFNPILPLSEYIPDGEPHVFGDRIYLFGSHDKEGGDRYCQWGNYVGWSAPLSDPADWSCSGEIYSPKQDPCYHEGDDVQLYAPDVAQGPDGRYYLYYCFGGSSGHSRVGVAVCDTPDGRYEYYGQVQNLDGSLCQEYLMGDPAVINDEGTPRLYCGWSLSLVAAGAHAQGSGFGNEKKNYGNVGPASANEAKERWNPAGAGVRPSAQAAFSAGGISAARTR